jgi:hypothetical protein
MAPWPWQRGKMECAHLIKYNGINLEISGLAFQPLQLGKLAVEQKLLQTVSHALMLLDASQYHFCQAVRNAPDEESRRSYYHLMMQDKVRAQDIWMSLAALTINPESKQVEEALIKMILESHSRALQVEQEQKIQIPKEKMEVNSRNTVEIGTSSFNDKFSELKNSYQQSPRSEEFQKAKSETTTTQITNSGLLLILTKKFTRERLKKLCSEYGIDYNEIHGQTVQEMARKLVTYLKQRDKLEDFYSYLTDYLTKSRPIGISILAILTVIGGIIVLASGLTLVYVGIGIILLALGIAYLIMAYGLWKGKGWAWTITLILSAVSVIVAIVSIYTGNAQAIFSLIINAVVIYYLYRPHVKAYFGKGVSLSPSAA